MARTHSPLRYPGGKSCLYPLITQLLELNGLRRTHYAEPYAGGGSLALSLLFAKQVSDIHLNDIDPGIWAFWKCILDKTDDFIELIEKTPINVQEWRKQREIFRDGDLSNPTKLGFSTFFLNRTNRSGIIGSGGVIGGLSQRGNYKIDCRFNKNDLVKRILRIKNHRSRIHLHRCDALDFIKFVDMELPKRTFCAIDPPYFEKGSSLYTSFYGPDDHTCVAEAILSLGKPWILTYDSADEISRLYFDQRQYPFDINYSVQSKRIGKELMIVSKDLRVTEAMRECQVLPAQLGAAA